MGSTVLSFLQVAGEPRPSSEPEPCFEVEVRYELTGGADVAAFVFCNPRADVHLGSHLLERVRVEVVRVGHSHAAREGSGSLLTPTFGDSHVPITFRVPLPLSLIESIQQERVKRGGDKEVLFDINPNLGMTPILPVSSGAEVAHVAGVTQVIHDRQLQREPVRFSRDEWLTLIEQVGYTSVLVVELPVANATHANVRAALEHLKTARSSFAHGNLDDVGVKAFKAFEALVPNAGRQQVFDAIKDDYFANANGEVAEAAKEMLVKLSKLYHIGGRHHAGGIPVARHHARFLLGAAEMVVAWCAELST
ncbi:MAG: hypothetical protein HS104_24885 [Polyangiaceae bacterium]|nr:hypothetical protein [Polyangiaceae bacterium]